MSNREKGEVSVDIGGTSYKLCLDMNAMIALEDYFTEKTGREVVFSDIFAKVQRNSMRHVQAFIWAAFQKHHPEKTLQDVNDLVQAYGGIFQFAGLIAGLSRATTPDPKDVKALGLDTPANPRGAQATKTAGTGARSRSKHAASA